MIEKCAFGSMTIDGRTYSSDLKILPDGHIKDGWWRAKGHRLNWEDIADLVELEPARLVIGTGIFGRMKPASDLKERLAGHSIHLVQAWSKKAAEAYNDALKQGIKIAACFHLTC